jgi:anti-sigma regulatory factor (Ser/Thr protein kinase)
VLRGRDGRLTDVGAARRFANDAMQGHELDPDLERDVVLLVSELVTNAVRYAGGATELRIDVDDRSVRVEVVDPEPTPARPLPPDPWASSGRGLQLVQELAGEWGQSGVNGGKVVWFVVGPTPR